MNMEETKILSDQLCEEFVIGTLLNRRREWFSNADILSADLFYHYKTNAIFNAAKSLVDQGKPADITTVPPELERQHANVTLQDVVELSSHQYFLDLRPYLLRLLEMKRRRALKLLFQTGSIEVYDEGTSVEEIMQKAQDTLSNILVTASTSIQSAKDVADNFTHKVVEANRRGTRTIGLLTGFKSLDDTGGLQLSDLVVIAADSSQGKTSLAINIADTVAYHGNSVAFYSMEMTSAQLYARMIAAHTGISSNVLCTRPLTDGQLELYAGASSQISQYHVYFDERSTSSLDNILASIRTLAYREKIKLAVVDYLQILNVNSRSLNAEQAMGDAARRFKNLAKELNICIVLLSQLSRDRDNPKPTISRLRSSGQIAEAADVVMLVYRPEYYGARFNYPDPYSKVSTKGTAMIDVAKGRNIGTRKFIVSFNPMLTKFSDLPQDRLPIKGESELKNDDPYYDMPF